MEVVEAPQMNAGIGMGLMPAIEQNRTLPLQVEVGVRTLVST